MRNPVRDTTQGPTTREPDEASTEPSVGAIHRPLCADGGSVSHALRDGGTLSVTTDAIVVDRGTADPIRIAVDNLVEVSLSSFDYFLGLLSVAIVGFGVLSLERNVLLGLAFVVVGLASAYRTYSRRGALTFRVTGRAKPLVVYPEYPQAVYDSLEPYVTAN